MTDLSNMVANSTGNNAGIDNDLAIQLPLQKKRKTSGIAAKASLIKHKVSRECKIKIFFFQILFNFFYNI